uniref:sulfatase n=1 Tax=Pararhizobium sp. IMCC3301 TaxID=3067904 RepID=UPI0027426300|nr:sulfatase [Pararhizobium sp. IMCC3301]
MKAVFLLFDSLCRDALGCYGGRIPTPNFDRLAAKGVTFDSHYVGSLPCMPARRDLQTGRLGFMHRSWGPLEPFDDSFPELLTKGGVYSHLSTDHYHYFEDGGSTYHNRYTTYDFIRGQEGDAWVPKVAPPIAEYRNNYHALQFEETRKGHRLQGLINRERIVKEEDFPCVRTFDAGLNFLRGNGAEKNWLLQLETFDPHEPFLAPARHRSKFPTSYQGPILDWPRYKAADTTPEETDEIRANYAALILLCDEQLGRLLDEFDVNDRWDDTAIVMTTDHGFMLGEHGWWGKNQMPFFNDIANIPLIIYHPDAAHRAGTRITALTQTIDIMPTLLEIFDQPIPTDVTGRSILPLMRGETDNIRDVAIFGIYGGAVNATDGQHTYFRYPDHMETTGMYEYTLMPVHNYNMFEPRELEAAELHPGFRFTKNVPVLKIPAVPDAKRSPRQGGFYDTETRLFDLATDREQSAPFRDVGTEERFCQLIAREMDLHDAPPELYARWKVTSSRQQTKPSGTLVEPDQDNRRNA